MGFLDYLRQTRAPKLHVALDHGVGHTVVLVHGIASSSVTFDNVVPLLGHHHRVIAIDLLGFGKSPRPATVWLQHGGACRCSSENTAVAALAGSDNVGWPFARRPHRHSLCSGVSEHAVSPGVGLTTGLSSR